MRSTVVRSAVVAVALTLVAGACGSGSGDSDTREAAEESPDGSARKTSARKQNISLSVAKAVELQPSGALNPTTAVDPDFGRVYAAWARELPAAGKEDPMMEAVVATSDDGGTTFGDAVAVSPAGMRVVSYTVSPTQVVVGHGGEVYVLFLENFPQDLPGWTYGFSFMRVVRSDDGGKTWSAPVALTSEATEGVTTSTPGRPGLRREPGARHHPVGLEGAQGQLRLGA